MTTRPRKPAPGTPAPGKLALTELAELKARHQPIVMMTAYDYPTARLVDEAGADIILVGDSLGMVVLGYDSTVPVTLDEMICSREAVVRGATARSSSPTCRSAATRARRRGATTRYGSCKEAGAEAVKLEGGRARAPAMRALVDADIPVMGHIGLTPQSVHQLGGYKVQGTTADAAVRCSTTREALDEAGASPSCSRSCPRRSPRDHASARRSRRSASAPARTATARCSSSTTCSASSIGPRRTSSSDTRSSPPRSSKRSARSWTRCASAASPRSSTPTPCRRRSWPSSRRL